MKTILITSFHPHISRNILGTSFLGDLLARGDVRAVIAAPHYKKDFFVRAFERDRVVIEGVRIGAGSRARTGLLFKRLAVLLMHSRTARIKKGFKFRQDRKFLRYLVGMLLGLAGALRPVRALVRHLDYHFSPVLPEMSSLFSAYRPAAVFATDIQNENDVAILQEAHRRGIPAIAMMRSWDNATQQLLRVIPDILCVGSDALAQETERYQDVSREKIRIVGVPHYDRYVQGPKETRREFFLRWGLDEHKPLALYAPCGDKFMVMNDLDQYVMEILCALPYQVIVRFPTNDTVRLQGFERGSAMRYDEPGVAFGKPKGGDREIGADDDERLMAELLYSDVVITGPSTIAIDAIFFDKPVILANFFQDSRPFWRTSVFFALDHLDRLRATGAAPMPRAREDFEALLAAYLADPRRDAEGRARARDLWLSHSLDGRAGKRLAHEVHSMLGS